MDTQPPPAGESRSNTSWLAGATSNTELLGTQQECSHKLVHHDSANVATKYMTQDTHLKIVRKTGSSKNKKQHAVRCEYILIMGNGSQLAVSRTTGLRRELRTELIASHNRKLSRSTKAVFCPVRQIEHCDVVSSWIFSHEFPDKCPRDWTKQASITLGEATEVYMVEVTAGFHFLNHRVMSCRFRTCLQLWQGKEVGYSWNSPTWAWCWTWPKWPKKAVIQRHVAMLCPNQMSGCIACQYGTAKNLQTGQRRLGTGAPLPTLPRVQTSEPIPPAPGTPPTPTINTFGAQPTEIVNLPAGYTYSHKALPCAEVSKDDEETEHNSNFDPDMLTDDG